MRCFEGATDYELTVTEGEGGFGIGPVDPGDGSGTGETLTADLSSGPVTVTLSGDYPFGDSVDVTVIPDNGQDISISSPDCVECGTIDDGEAGAAEFYFFDVVDEGGTHQITITPVGDADSTGTVTIMVSSFGPA